LTRHGTVPALTNRVKQQALACGFDAVGITPATVLEPERERYLRWIEEGRQGQMRWIDSTWAERSADPRTLLPEARSVICVALSYHSRPLGQRPAGYGRMARYAWTRDYHQVVGEKLARLCSTLADLGGRSRPFVDTAPAMDKALATRAGIGWQSKNTNVLSRRWGSFTYLGGVVTDLELLPDRPAQDGCGRCTACVRACPTGALKGDYTIDARLCISYLTIEHRGPIPRELRPLMGAWVVGCDICQDVCPVVTDLQDRDFPVARELRVQATREAFRESPARPSETG